MEDTFWKEVDKGLAAVGQRRPWLAAKTGISLGRINNWYNRGTLPRVDDAVAIAEALEVPVRQLVTGETRLSFNHIPPELAEQIERYTRLSEGHKEQVLTICRAVMVMMDQGLLTMPLDAYFRTRDRRGDPLSGSQQSGESDRGGYIF